MSTFAVRLMLARHLRGMAKSELAAKLRVSNASVAHWESGRSEPAPDRLRLLASALSLPVEFFTRDDVPIVPAHTVSFRSLRSISARDRDKAIGTASLAVDLSNWIAQRFRLPAPALPDLSGSEPTVAAVEMRRTLQLGDGPLPPTVSLLESLGVRCFSLGRDIQKADALSAWIAGTPVVLFNVTKSAERSRNDAAHELGHLVLHRHQLPVGADPEREAVAFAAEFLVPAASLVREATSQVTLSSLLRLKQRWGVSAAFMMKRLHDLRLVSEWSARSLWQQLSAAGYRSNEPYGMARESSQVLTQVLEHLRTKHRRPFTVIAQDLRLTVADVRARFDGLLPLNLQDGGGEELDDSSATPPPLQLIT